MIGELRPLKEAASAQCARVCPLCAHMLAATGICGALQGGFQAGSESMRSLSSASLGASMLPANVPHLFVRCAIGVLYGARRFVAPYVCLGQLKKPILFSRGSAPHPVDLSVTSSESRIRPGSRVRALGGSVFRSYRIEKIAI